MFQEFKNFKPSTGETEDFNAEKFYNIIKMFEALEDINISFVGSFIWLTDLTPGAMYSQKDLIKGITIENYNSPRWARLKKSWYFSPADYVKKNGKQRDLEDIKSYYGSKDFQTKGSFKLAM
ncbi:hypothetical protein [Flavobacterium sp. JP2137]|uniref:hypothetical protein n=1 Tax=Flavobacterium sp. JP2137 TaxID=3414510 RepID=UPI003D2FAF20